jgi:hypothetical protein
MRVIQAAMAHRNASAAIYVSKSPDGLRREIGDWAKGAMGQSIGDLCGRILPLAGGGRVTCESRSLQPTI